MVSKLWRAYEAGRMQGNGTAHPTTLPYQMESSEALQAYSEGYRAGMEEWLSCHVVTDEAIDDLGWLENGF